MSFPPRSRGTHVRTTGSEVIKKWGGCSEPLSSFSAHLLILSCPLPLGAGSYLLVHWHSAFQMWSDQKVRYLNEWVDNQDHWTAGLRRVTCATVPWHALLRKRGKKDLTMVGWSHHLVSLVVESPPRGPLEVGVRAVSQVHSRMDAALPKLQASADPLSSPSQPSDLSLYLASLVFAHVDGTGGEGLSIPDSRTLTQDSSYSPKHCK